MRDGAITEADTYLELMTPKLLETGRGTAPYANLEHRSFANGHIVVTGGHVRFLDKQIALPPQHIQQTIDLLQTEVATLQANHLSIRVAHVRLLPAPVDRAFRKGY